MRFIYIALLLLISTFAQAQTVGPSCVLAWDYDPAEISRVDSFEVYVDGAQALSVPSTQQQVTCSEIGMTEGERTLAVTAKNAVAESLPSNALTVSYVESGPAPPTTLRVVVSIEVQVQ
jgi:hypothetical protein